MALRKVARQFLVIVKPRRANMGMAIVAAPAANTELTLVPVVAPLPTELLIVACTAWGYVFFVRLLVCRATAAATVAVKDKHMQNFEPSCPAQVALASPG